MNYQAGATLSLALVLCPIPSGAQSAVAPAGRDSAGIRIVEHSRVVGLASRIGLSPTPLVDLAGLRSDPREELDVRVPFLIAKPLSDGRWVLMDFASLLIVDPDGKFVRRVGRAGSGPGEFRQLRDVCVGPADTLLAISMADRRIVVFDSSGRHVKTRGYEGDLPRTPCAPDGSFLIARSPGTNPLSVLPAREASLWDRVATFDLVRWDGFVRRSMGPFPVEDLELTFRLTVNVVASGGRYYVGNGSGPEYRAYDASGELFQIVRWRHDMRRATPALREAAVRRGVLSGPATRDFLPVYRTITASPGGEVWIQEYSTEGQARWFVFDRHGAFLGRVDAPAAMRGRVDLQPLDSDRVILAWRDDEGAPRLTIHAVIRRDASR